MHWQWLEQFHLAQRNLVSDGSVILIELGILLVAFILLRFILKFTQTKLTLIQPHLAQSFEGTFKLLRIILNLLFFFSFVGILGLNLYQFYLGTDLKSYTMNNIDKIPHDFWKNLGIGIAKIIALIVVAKFAIKKTLPLLEKIRDKAVAYKGLKENDKAVISFFSRFMSMFKNTIWILVLYAVSQWFPLPESIGTYILLGLRIYVTISLAILLVNAVDAIVATIDDFSKHYASKNNFILFYDSLHHLVPLFKKTIEYMIYVSAATMVVSQLDFISWLAAYGSGVIRSIGIIFISRVVIEVAKLLIDITFLHDGLDEESKKRNETIFPIIKSIIAALIYFVAVVLILKSFGFDPLPLLAGAGILGMVIGLGAQQLINDIVSGFFIIVEQSIQKGDYIKCGDAEGVVENIGLRITKIRSDDGELHIIKNGEIKELINYSHKFVNAVVNVGVAATSDLDFVYKTLRELGKELRDSHEDILDILSVDGVEDISGPEIVIRTITKVKPGQHRLLKRLIQERIVSLFKEKGIEIPFEKRYDI